MKLKIFALLVIINFSCKIRVDAQHISTAGKEFLVGFMYNYIGTGTEALNLRISGSKATTGLITGGVAGSYTQPFSVNPGIVTVVSIPSALFQCENSEVAEDKGLRIVADDTIYVFAENFIAFTTDATVVLPVTALGSEYIVASYTGSSEFLVVADADDTKIKIYPSDDTDGGYSKGDEIVETLQAGQTYLVASGAGDLTGSRVVCTDPCKKIAVYGGAVCTNVPSAFGTCDHLYEQLYPLNTWGTKYVTIPFNTRGKDVYRVLAGYNNTKVSVTENKKTTNYTLLKAGDFKEFSMVKTGLVKADKPISLIQYSAGDSYDGDDDNGDPFMLLVTPIEQKIDNITFNIIIPGNDVHFANVFTKTSNVSTMTLNGTSISSNFTRLTSDTSISWVQQPLDTKNGVVSDFTLHGKDGFNACIYGFGVDNSYGYSAGGKLDNIAFDFTYTDSLCAGNEFLFFDSIPFVFDKIVWYFGDGDSALTSKPKHIFANQGKYNIKLKVREAACLPFKEIEKTLTVIPPPSTPTASGNANICAGDSLTLNASSTEPNITFEWYNNAEDLLLNTGNSFPTHALVSSTSYKLRVKSKNCYSDFTPININVIPSPTSADVTASKDTINSGESADIEVKNIIGGSGNYNYSWNPNIGNGPGPHTVSPHTNTTYYVTISDQNNSNCKYIDSVSISLNSGSIFIPNAFSPNADNSYDTFKPIGDGIVNYSITIFDRWGKIIFTSKNINDPWNGKLNNNGQECIEGVYIYIINVTLQNDLKNQRFIGHVSLTK